MKPILYRAKAINRNPNMNYRTDYQNGDWVYGLVSKLYKYDNKYFAEMTNTDGVSGIDVDPETICEYTGLTDKNGNKIFEGDIVQWGMNGLEIPIRKAVVETLPDIQFRCLNLKDSEGKHHIFNYGNFAYRDTEKYLEIIGNIYDSPELLEK